MASLRQNVSTAQCARCRKTFMPGDRVVSVFIVQQIGKNPKAAWEQGAFLGDDFELAHVSCADTGLEGKIIT